jgi:hypothetical protein
MPLANRNLIDGDLPEMFQLRLGVTVHGLKLVERYFS